MTDGINPGRDDVDAPALTAVEFAPLDAVIQRLFALGLTVQSVAVSLLGDERGSKLSGVVAGIDAVIGDVRAQLRTSPEDRDPPPGPTGPVL